MRFFSNSGLRGGAIRAMRHHLRRWQPQLRSLFVMRIDSFKYRLRVSGYELPRPGEPSSIPITHSRAVETATRSGILCGQGTPPFLYFILVVSEG